MSRKKILFVITKSVWGGAGMYVYDLATNLPTDAFDVAVAAGGNGLLFQKLRSAGVRTIHIPELDRDIHVGKELRSLRALVNLFQREQPDVIHLNSAKAGGLGALAGRVTGWRVGKKTKIVFTPHGWAFFEDRPLWWRAAAFFLSWLSTLFQDKIILINGRDYAAARKFIPKRKLTLIHNGLAEHTLMSHEQARAFFAKKIKRAIPTDAVLIGTIAELTKNKGLGYLIDGIEYMRCHSRENGNPEHKTTGFPTRFARAPARRVKSGMTHGKNTDFKVLIIGEGEDRQKLEQQIHSRHLEDKVFLLGFVPDASQYISGMDIFVLPSRKEGLPYAIMEAMDGGVPVVASDIGGIPDLISHNETGILVPPKDPQALAEAIESLIQDPQRRTVLGKRASEVVRTKFSLRVMLERTQQLYEATD